MKILIITIILISITSCKYSSTYVKLQNLSDKKIEIEAISSESLSTENHRTLREYFSTIKDLSYSFKINSKMRRYSQKKFTKYFNKDFCQNGLVSAHAYNQILNKCNVSGFYICSEEVKYYSLMLNQVRELLTSFQLNKILEDEQCETKLKELGVISE